MLRKYLQEEVWQDTLISSYVIATRSKDPSTQNGAILLAEDNRAVGLGHNHFPKGVDPKHWDGPKEDKYARVVHAEVSAILDAAKLGNSTLNTTLVCAWSACSNCAKHIVDAGVARLVRHSYANNGADTGAHWYKDCEIGDEIMRDASIEIVELDPVPYNVQLRRNGQLWSPGAS